MHENKGVVRGNIVSINYLCANLALKLIPSPQESTL